MIVILRGFVVLSLSPFRFLLSSAVGIGIPNGEEPADGNPDYSNEWKADGIGSQSRGEASTTTEQDDNYWESWPNGETGGWGWNFGLVIGEKQAEIARSFMISVEDSGGQGIPDGKVEEILAVAVRNNWMTDSKKKRLAKDLKGKDATCQERILGLETNRLWPQDQSIIPFVLKSRPFRHSWPSEEEEIGKVFLNIVHDNVPDDGIVDLWKTLLCNALTKTYPDRYTHCAVVAVDWGKRPNEIIVVEDERSRLEKMGKFIYSGAKKYIEQKLSRTQQKEMH